MMTKYLYQFEFNQTRAQISAGRLQKEEEPVLTAHPLVESVNIIDENEDMAYTSANRMGCNSIHKVGNYWAPCEAPENKN